VTTTPLMSSQRPYNGIAGWGGTGRLAVESRTTWTEGTPRIELEKHVGAPVRRSRRDTFELGPPKNPGQASDPYTCPPFLGGRLMTHTESTTRNARVRVTGPGPTEACIDGPTSAPCMLPGTDRPTRTKAWAGDPNHELHFHDLRHTHKTCFIEDHVPPRGCNSSDSAHKNPKGGGGGRIRPLSHVTTVMIRGVLHVLQRRWEQFR